MADLLPEQNISVKLWRGRESGEFQSYTVELRQNQTVLDVVTDIQKQFEPSLAYRFACRVGVCGSCAMTVNGKPRWTCRTHVKEVLQGDQITIEPLRNLPIIKDLVCDLKPFFNKWQKAGGVFKGSGSRYQLPALLNSESTARQAADAAVECINCAVCYSACDVVGWDQDYAGPAALNRVWTLVNDARHRQRRATLNVAFEGGHCHACHSHGNCTRHCPIGLSPSHSIAALKKAALFGPPRLADAEYATPKPPPVQPDTRTP